MRQNFESAFKIVVGLEGEPTVDEGGLTVFGLAQRYNPMVSLNMKIDEAKEIYLNKYWIPTGCDTAPFPMDICLFDAKVNPPGRPDTAGRAVRCRSY